MDVVAATNVTRLLGDINAGKASMSDLLPIVYEELRSQAHQMLGRRDRDRTLQTTCLVNEVAARLLDHTKVDWADRVHFFALCARAMRQILTDYARRRSADKRGPAWDRVALFDDADKANQPQIDVLAFNEVLDNLSALNERMGQVVECRFFAGMTNKEIAQVLSVSVATVENDWRAAKAWLSHELRRDGAA